MTEQTREQVVLSIVQTAELHEDGAVWLHDNATMQDIQLDAKAATLLFDFLLLHMEQLIHRSAAEEKAKKYNREMDARNRINYENREKPWLPGYDGE